MSSESADNMDVNKSSDITLSNDVNNVYDSELNSFSIIYLIIEKYSELVVLPIIGAVGLVGNVLSGIIITKDGFQKPSNILLLGLAVADYFLLLDTVNVSRMMLHATPLTHFWIMELDSITVCYNLMRATQFVISLAYRMSILLTVCITLERIVDVYFPLRFHTLVTPKRATIVVIISFVMAVPVVIIGQFKYALYADYFKPMGGFIGTLSMRTDWLGSWMELLVTFNERYIVPIVPTTIISTGCVMIGGKVTITMRRRKNLTSSSAKDRSSSARTRTLFMVSFFFFVTHIFWLFSFFPQIKSTSAYHPVHFYMGRMMVYFSNFLIYLNGACNVFIYAIFNPKFRKLLRKLLCRSTRDTK